ncbi:DUF2975 domain-containing protein [Desulfotomaculum sp. 1211_IL3151]|uniref:DUF2975 domain-containing protein n=1 Tax=Desulfotomaculum sp. 1211_IL3151 TaxID=3084055 RepID=UPI002FD8BB04
MKPETLFLKIAVILMGLPVLVLCLLGLFWLAKDTVNPDYAPMLYPIVIGMYSASIPFYFALYQAIKLLSHIDKNKAFSELSVQNLKNIKYCAIAISTLYVLIMPFVYLFAEQDDAPGLLIIGMVIIFASMVIAVFAAVLQKLLKYAIDIKSENDLTV